jgi:hypothetical protein
MAAERVSVSLIVPKLSGEASVFAEVCEAA